MRVPDLRYTVMMHKFILSAVTGLLIVITFTNTTVFAARNSSANSSTQANSLLGNDISYPQCSKSWPKNQAFGIVGINGGVANNTNPCLKDQIQWTNRSTGASSQEKVQFYVNTANPGGLGTASWPNWSNSQNIYGICDGSDNLACAWQYGWNRADEDVNIRFLPAATQAKIGTDASKYIWWLDVETLNTWKPAINDLNAKSNAAVLEGMTAYFQSINARVGLYSTGYQWGQIVGNGVSELSVLNGLPNWRPGGANLNTSKQACNSSPLTKDGKIVLTQYIYKNLDYNYSCNG